jgi:type IV fimbrial biogenesis protein FimT
MKMTGTLLAARQHGSGFTLIELMTTMTIVGVLLAIGVPGMFDLIRDARLSSSSDSLVSALNAARLEAVKQRTDFKVCQAITPATAVACAAAATDWSKGWVVMKASDSAISQRVETKTGLSISTTSTGVTFSGTLGATTAVTTFTLCVKGRKEHVVTVSLSGHISKRVGTTDCL